MSHSATKKKSNSKRKPIRLPEDEAKIIFKTAYQQFRKKEYTDSLRTLDSVLGNVKEIENDKLNLLSLMWGIAGDSLASLKSVDDAVFAYRKSIELDTYSGCIMGYAWFVAKYEIRSELPFAYNCLLSYKEHLRSGSKRWQIFGFLFVLFTMPSICWDLNIRAFFVKNKLKKMVQKGL